MENYSVYQRKKRNKQIIGLSLVMLVFFLKKNLQVTLKKKFFFFQNNHLCNNYKIFKKIIKGVSKKLKYLYIYCYL